MRSKIFRRRSPLTFSTSAIWRHWTSRTRPPMLSHSSCAARSLPENGCRRPKARSRSRAPPAPRTRMRNSAWPALSSPIPGNRSASPTLPLSPASPRWPGATRPEWRRCAPPRRRCRSRWRNGCSRGRSTGGMLPPPPAFSKWRPRRAVPWRNRAWPSCTWRASASRRTRPPPGGGPSLPPMPARVSPSTSSRAWRKRTRRPRAFRRRSPSISGSCRSRRVSVAPKDRRPRPC